MATQNLKLTIVKPGRNGISSPIAFQTVTTAGDTLFIPRRYPFADIANYTALKAAGYFRHATTTVSSELGGSATTNTEGKLGFELPRTEKLILLMRVNTAIDTATTDDVTVTIKGSLEYKIPDTVIFLDETNYEGGTTHAAGTIYEVDLSNMGLFLGGVASTAGVSIVASTTTVEFALIVREA